MFVNLERKYIKTRISLGVLIKMEYTKMRTVELSSDKSRWNKCSVCGEKKDYFHTTTDYKLVCFSCREKDENSKLD